MSIYKYILEIKRDLTGNKNWTRYRYINAPELYGTLDESLDCGRVELLPIDCALDFKPFTPVRVRAYAVPDIMYDIDGKTDAELKVLAESGIISLDETLYMCVSDPEKVMYAPRYEGDATEPTKALWKHSFALVEPTKTIERRPGGVMCFTNPLNKGYTEKTKECVPIIECYKLKSFEDLNSIIEDASNYYKSFIESFLQGIDLNLYVSPIIKPYKITGIVPYSKNSYSLATMIQIVKLHGPDGSSIELVNNRSVNPNNLNFTAELTDYGQYKLETIFSCIATDGAFDTQTPYKVSYSYNIEIVEDDSADYTVTEVFERILSAARTRKLSQPQEYYLNGYDERHTLDGVENETLKFFNVRAPEIVVEGTLWEMLLSAASYIHYIPRLNYNPKTEEFDVITLDELGGSNVCPAVPERVIAYTKSIATNDYCGEVDCTAENLINTQDERAGTVVEPFIGGWKSVRSDSSVDIKNDTALHRNTYTHYRMTKLEVRNRLTTENGDITPFLYESAEWDCLDNYSETYPLSRAYALKYEQGGQTITEINHTVESVSALLKTPAIANILPRIGVTVPASYNDLQFRATYIPVTRKRITQKKAFIDEDYEGNALYYNQPEAQVECDSFGRGIAGYVEKIGNGEIKATFLFSSIKDIPKPGQLFTIFGETGYVTNVNRQLDFKIKATVVISPNYNRLSEAYSGVKSNKRYADVSEKQSYYRCVNYGEDIIIGDMIVGAARESMLTPQGQRAFMNVFHPPAGSGNPASAVVVTHKSKNGSTVARLVMPLDTAAAGRAMTFSWAYKNNYGAEDQSVEVPGDDIASKSKRAQREVRIGNLNGQFRCMDIEMHPTLDLTTEQTNRVAHSFPELPADITPNAANAYLNIEDLLIDHDNREQLGVTIEAHCRTNRRNMIIGSALTTKNPLVRGYGDLAAPVLYYFTRPLNRLNSVVSADFVTNYGHGGETISWSELSANVFKLTLPANAGESAASWAILQPVVRDGVPEYYQIMLGDNAGVAAGEAPREVYITFTDNNKNLMVEFSDRYIATAVPEGCDLIRAGFEGEAINTDQYSPNTLLLKATFADSRIIGYSQETDIGLLP